MPRFVDVAPRSAPWRVLHRVADHHIAAFAATFTESVLRVRESISDALVEEDMARGLVEPPRGILAAIERIQFAKASEAAERGAERAYARIMSGVVLDMVDFVEREMGQRAAEVALSFSVISPQVLRAAETLTALLIREVSAETRRAVQRIIFNSIRDGVAPRDAAKLVRNVIGLTERQALSVATFRDGLVKAKTPPARVERLTERLAQRKLKDRSLTIARTETMRAANRGQTLLWQEMVKDRLVDTRTFRQRWLTTPDDRLCPRCAPLNGKVTHIGGSFSETERGVLPSDRVSVAGETTQSPPLHPRCRCVLVADVPD